MSKELDKITNASIEVAITIYQSMVDAGVEIPDKNRKQLEKLIEIVEGRESQK